MIQPKLKITKHSTPAEYQQIRKYVIDSVLESGCAPKRLASMREMAGFFKVSTATVQRALKELVDDDYLTVKPGIGLFTNPDRGWLREKTEVIGVLAADGRQIYYENFLWDLLSAVGRRITSGRKLLYPINLFHTAGHVPESLAFLSMTGLIWLGPDFAPSAAADAFFAALTVPAVTVSLTGCTKRQPSSRQSRSASGVERFSQPGRKQISIPASSSRTRSNCSRLLIDR